MPDLYDDLFLHVNFYTSPKVNTTKIGGRRWRPADSPVTYFLSQEKALLLLSFRYLSDDHFWFTFFHEAGHLLLHKRTLFLEGGETVPTKEEAEANDFAATTLVPKTCESEMLKLPLNGIAVIRFAKSIGVSPGIVVGQLQHRGVFTQRQLNNLKRRFIWSD